MGRRKKSQASKLTTGQDDDPHDNLSEIRKALVENAALQAQLKKELCLLRASEPETKSPNPTVVAGSSKRRPSAQGSLNMLPASYVLDPCPSECGKSVISMKQPKQAEQTKSESVARMKQPKQSEETKCESVASMKQPNQAEETKCESVASMKQPKQAEETKCESVASMKQPKQAEETKCEGTVKKRCKPIAKQSWKPPITGMPFWLQAPLPETELLPRRK
ncbi:unnamed protein product [Prunus armeniaca]|uniref:Uncharacterized protein n=1 Tax=Prunus armeniaca TaxID=36596 RepID=A0A6J5UWA8_PRUAR|nr:unnamed protein product [Prunus armeniaca]CAB4311397.1 unnamed protein product [Prunus armeniaca]